MSSIFSANSFGSAEAPIELNLGFYQENSAEIPLAVREQSKFIYRLNISNFTSVKAESYKNLIENSNISATAKVDLKACSDALLPNCMIPFGDIRGSAFLDESGSSLWTNCHIVQSWIEYKKQKLLLLGTEPSTLLKKLMSSAIPFTLIKTDSSIALTSMENSAATLEAMVPINRSKPERLNCSPINDAVKIRLPYSLSNRGILRSKNYPLFQPVQKIFLGGHPRATNSRASIGKLDSDGNHFYWTLGSILLKGPEQEAYFASRASSLAGISLDGPYAQTVLADSIEGMSGGPALNENGEMVGIYKGFVPFSPSQKDTPFVSIILDKGELRFIEIYSENL